MGAEVVSAGLVDTAPAAHKAGDLFACANVDLIVCYVAPTPPRRRCCRPCSARAPVLILNLQPAAALDYPNTDTGEWLAHCSACCVPEIANAFARSRIPVQRGQRAARSLRRATPVCTSTAPGARSPIG